MKQNRITSAGHSSNTIVSRSPGERLVDLCRHKRVAFLENGHFLFDECETVGEYLSENKIDFTAICDVQKQGMEAVLRQCRDKDVIIYQTTWTYEVSNQLKKAFMSIQNPEFKKSFVEISAGEPTFTKVPKGVIHELYALDIYERDEPEWVFIKLNKVTPYWKLKG
jgi:hypothetical protein